jgi:hypothetical protein
MSISSCVFLLKFEAHFAYYLETRHFFFSAHTYPLQPEAILVCHGALPNLQTSKRKLESNIFAANLLPPS